MSDLSTRLQALQARITANPSASELGALENEARALMTQAKNTEYEGQARELFKQLAQRTTPGVGGEVSAELRALLRRAKIRVDVASDATDLDEAIDILAKALALDPRHPETQSLLRQAAERSPQHSLKVRGILERYGVDLHATDAKLPLSPALANDEDNESSTVNLTATPVMLPPASQPIAPLPSEGNPLAEVSKAYYAGDYQRAIEVADRILQSDPNNAQAQDYRQKAADNLLRGVVPDSRIPFDARIAYNRANSLVRAGNYDEAQKLYREARELAARAGIPQWNDVEQALLDIEDLALARDLLNEGDRLLAQDEWENAQRKYEQSLRVVPNDPLTENRLEVVKRVRGQYDQAVVQLNMMTGSLFERAEAAKRLLGTLAVLRQTLPTSERLGQLVAEIQTRMDGTKGQLLTQANNLLARAENATLAEEKSKLAQEAQMLVSAALNLDPTDPNAASLLHRAESLSGQLGEQRSLLEQARAFIAQNTESDLAQARAILSAWKDSPNDPRYRATVADLLASHLGYIEAALDRGEVAMAERWLKVSKEEPFRILGRRTELLSLEDQIRAMKRGRLLMRLGFVFGGVLLLGLLALLTRDQWEAAFFPTATPTATITLTPSATATFTATATASATPTPTMTATFTVTPSPTITPSFTVTASLTPTHTDTPTHTFTPSLTPIPSETPVPSPTPAVLCRVFVNENAVNVRALPSTGAQVVVQAQRNQAMDVLEQRRADDGQVWYRIVYSISGARVEGWVRSNVVVDLTACPEF
jgi:tetratricopeptide (TPR) repeat protein